jgi:hypothetical protein
MKIWLQFFAALFTNFALLPSAAADQLPMRSPFGVFV